MPHSAQSDAVPTASRVGGIARGSSALHAATEYGEAEHAAARPGGSLTASAEAWLTLGTRP